jgi:putative transposase
VKELRAFRVELDLTIEQLRWCERACAASRITYNWGLAEWQRWYRWEQIEKSGKKDRALSLIVLWASLEPKLPVRRAPDFAGKPTAFGVSARLTQEKKRSLAWLHELNNAYIMRESIGALGTAYAAFFRRLKKHRKGDHSECGKSMRGRCSLGAPRFHARREDEGFICNEAKRLATGTEENRGFLVVPGLGRAYTKRGQKLPTASFSAKAAGIDCTCGKPKGVRGKHKPGCEGRTGGWIGDGTELCGVGIRRWGGRWYASIRARAVIRGDRKRVEGKRIAVEVGLRYRAVTFDGHRVGAFADTRKAVPSATKLRRIADETGTPEAIEAALQARRSHGSERLLKLETKRKLWERRQARRWTAGKSVREQSEGWREARSKVANLHRQIAQYRADRIHFVSRVIVNSGAEEIVTRDMKVKELLQRGSAEDPRVRNVLADDVQKAGMSELQRELEYKQRWAGGKSTEVPATVTETKVCWVCGTTRETPPGYPWFSCANCGNQEDRDVNAAVVRHAHGEAAE